MRSDTQRAGELDLAGGRRLAWCEYGDPAGWPVVFCHGMPGSRLEQPPDSAPAMERGLRVLVPDRPGYGGTSPLPGRVLGEEVADLAALVDHLGLGRFDVLGFSGGGPHALAAAHALPERVRRLGLIGSLAPFDQAGTAGMAEANRQLWELARADFASFAAALEEAVATAGSVYDVLVGGAPPEDQAVFADAELAAAYRRDTEEGMAQGLTGMLEDAAALLAEWPFAVADVRAPARLWHGERDGNAPLGMGRWLAGRLPQAGLTEWPGAGHFAWLRRWDEVLEGLTAA